MYSLYQNIFKFNTGTRFFFEGHIKRLKTAVQRKNTVSAYFTSSRVRTSPGKSLNLKRKNPGLESLEFC